MEVATSELLVVEHDAEVAILTMNRPNQRNALSLALMSRLIAGLEDLSAHPDVRVVILRGSGPAFCAGHDLAEMRGLELDG